MKEYKPLEKSNCCRVAIRRMKLYPKQIRCTLCGKDCKLAPIHWFNPTNVWIGKRTGQGRWATKNDLKKFDYPITQ